MNTRKTENNIDIDIFLEKYKSLKGQNFYPNNVNIPNSFNWTKTYKYFLSEHSLEIWKINWKFNRVNNFLLSIENNVSNWLDPVEYLYHLYYNIKLSVNDISIILKKYWNYTESGIRWIFRDRFWWELREANAKDNQTLVRNEKDSKKIKPLIEISTKEKNENIEKVENILSRIAKNKEKTRFSKKIFDKLKNVADRTKYILDITWYIPEENFETILIQFSDKYWMKVTAQAITNILEEQTNKKRNIKKIHLRAWRIKEIKDKQN